MKIFIDPGHGGTDPGAVSKIKESDYTLPFALELGKVLAKLGFTIEYSRTTDKTLSLSERCKLANQSGADYFISIHLNAGGGVGIETFALSAGGNAEKLAKYVQTALIDSTGMVNRGVKFANYQVLRDTKMPAILIESGFVDSSDADKIKTELYKQNFVRGVSRGVCAFLNVPWRDPYTVAEPPSEQPTTDPDVFLLVRVRKSKSDNLAKQILDMGFANKKVEI